MTRALRWALVTIAVLLVAVVAVGSVVLWPVFFPDSPRLRVPGGDSPGSVVAASDYGDLTVPMKLVRAQGASITYVSTDPSGRPIRVTGTSFVPGGTPPQGGWPVVALAHGTTGIDQACAPSRSPELGGLLSIAQSLVGAGYAVAVPDYQGLGAPGVHPYLDSPTAGRDVLDAVRATRTVFGSVSARWAGFGSSQGGGVIWAADEESAGYAPDLTPLGVVAAAPAADVVGLVDKSIAGTLTSDQAPSLQLFIEAAARANPQIVRDDYRSANGARLWDTLSSCSAAAGANRAAAIAALRPGDIAPRTAEAAARLRALLTSYALPQRRASAPLLVLFGDADTFIDAAWTRAAVQRACALGDTIKAVEQPGRGHGDVDITTALPWLRDRFAGLPAPTSCGR
ncbi:lipase family protein [Williamsia deligens]|uniref:Lipase family protein n=1 Tax=Williamsia deligens TaxID=321325 RepID=A0ABW3G9M8_9NOCA|nr:lipase family protein [Williamsia deligens]MCP2195752.1 Secretory lipase [Williamsia deligens]